MALLLDVERREPLKEGIECYQVEDGTVFHFKFTVPRLLWTSAKNPLANILFDDIVKIIAYGNALYFNTTQGKIYRATAAEADGLEVEFFRDLNETDSVDASGLCCRTEEWKKFIHPMYQDPRFRNYIYEIPSDRISGGTLKGIHRDKLIYLKHGSTSGIRLLSTLAIQITLPIDETDSKLYAANSSSLMFVSNGDNIHVFTTNSMEPLPTLQFSGFSAISIVGIYKGVITVTGRKARRCYLARASIPDDYLNQCASIEADPWIPDDYYPSTKRKYTIINENECVNVWNPMHEQSSLESESSATINDLLDKNGQLAQQIAGFNKITDENDMIQFPCSIINKMKQLEKVKMQQENENEEMRATLERVATRNKELGGANAHLNEKKRLLIRQEEEMENRMVSTVSVMGTSNVKTRFDSVRTKNANLAKELSKKITELKKIHDENALTMQKCNKN